MRNLVVQVGQNIPNSQLCPKRTVLTRTYVPNDDMPVARPWIQ